MTTTASHHLSPAFPGRAPWGTAGKLRAWQQGAMEKYVQEQPRDFLAVATPGAGKTTFALTLASWLLHHHVVQQVTVVAPTEHLKKQWAEAAARIGIKLDPDYSAGPVSKEYHGVAVTYAGVGVRPMLHRNRCEQRKTLVILDEIHHAGDSKSWGEACQEAFDPATRRLALTGTPFRSDTNPIPFVAYEEGNDGIRRSSADYTYGYGNALADGVVRPVIFLSYSGNMRWRTKAGDEIAARLGEPMTKDAIGQAWRTALSPTGDWIPNVLAAADKRLTEVRKGIPDAGGLVIATDQESARAYAKILKSVTGEKPTVVLSDEKAASKNIDKFSQDTSRWMVAVRMVSEGVDVPRLAVGVYATTISTPLFFAQAVGRFVRSRRRGETASVFLPTIPMLLDFANEMEVERDHVLDKPKKGSDEENPFAEEDQLLADAEKLEDEETEEQLPFEALESDAVFDRVLYDGAEFGMQAHPGSEEEQDYLGIPGLLEPDQVQLLLQKRQTRQIAHSRQKPASEADLLEKAAEDRPVVTHKKLLELRKQLNTMVSAYTHQSGKPHGVIHTELRRVCGGPPSAEATAGQIQDRIKKVQEWATRMR
ncbi:MULTISPECIES: DEAD/DEAH box helicase [unclassified Streptomyces]|uniref:DEAD/DEAH box helicase n=1 Tax=Streptomyces TaxID=1883 RepID=UPI000223B378|nr:MULTISPECIES: DEAD/DEAH box helicase [unclassified Streptomyces]MYR64978.1 DEAD/DEAH box helicase family protein [Streptomyces sp. SID4939]MYS00101.1 DEAD/DEAH box helicase family protein [Streptomyces sp. SID4940]MYT65449.1 DEAD/DEAH box helicase family protein [Streptomyces sp. SID8357]MYT84504.1 DEAD/DEAH box helicase family protein [Streptomyces sp. SID8360]MYU37154.1 DEAD/DEAH box helicase family protein [Streptomyces sp. SID8358]MYW37770.1 DEAD/DEAH box helicase family protein [Strep